MPVPSRFGSVCLEPGNSRWYRKSYVKVWKIELMTSVFVFSHFKRERKTVTVKMIAKFKEIHHTYYISNT